MYFNCDCHVHTRRSFCGADDVTVEALVDLMSERGIKRFAVTDHSSHFYFDDTDSAWNVDIVLDPNKLAGNHDKAAKAIRDHLAMIRTFSAKGILAGLEVDVTFSGDLVLPPGIKDELDVVVGAVHWLPGLSREHKPPLKQVVRDFLRLTFALLEQGIDILAHPTRIFGWNGLEVPERVVNPVIEAAIANNVALEINAHSEDPNAFFVKRCLEKEAKIAIGTDAHTLEAFGDFSYHRNILSQCGVSEGDLKTILFSPGKEKS